MMKMNKLMQFRGTYRAHGYTLWAKCGVPSCQIRWFT